MTNTPTYIPVPQTEEYCSVCNKENPVKLLNGTAFPHIIGTKKWVAGLCDGSGEKVIKKTVIK